ncbi:uncharacterized enzyme related with pigment biosynthesis [Anaerolinea thermolimosa]|uniref:pseudouridine-5'-phosphate glycosidase n=1 Tax=Anaerolinea thermolimosa TaxID=229919 RepID=UPI00078068A0|nr:pseudouridine-5'-phosphate glycosidase [Anaerolinea thermolimosa]GAP06940.1 uncharacterized enzyme related with pigment biosynthesis [Anaerolinea thermolimosa]
MNIPLHFSSEVARARQAGQAVLALESAVITHGLPHPINLELARLLEDEVRGVGVTPATIAIMDGAVRVGLDENALERLATMTPDRKMSRRDLAIALSRRLSGGTTVAGTLLIARMAGIQVFSTGGIGGVHRGSRWDVSADLEELARSPLVVVCSGAKAILDLEATVEMLETLGVPVIGFRTHSFPAFYSGDSGLPVDIMVDSVEEVVDIALRHWQLGLTGAVLVVQAPPEEVAIPYDQMEGIIQEALQEAQKKGIRGSAVTPFLLARVSELSGGESLQANLALLKNNARLGAKIALQLVNSRRLTG